MSILFCKGDKVVAKNPMLGLPMTVQKVTTAGYCVCNFVFSDRPAGSFLHHELKFQDVEVSVIPQRTLPVRTADRSL